MVYKLLTRWYLLFQNIVSLFVSCCGPESRLWGIEDDVFHFFPIGYVQRYINQIKENKVR